MDNIEKMQQLIATLNKYSYAYYTMDNPMVSDAEYDELYNQLETLEKETNTVLEGSPTKRVGDVVLEKFEKHTHLGRLWSLDKSKTMEELVDWETRNKKILLLAGINKPIEYVVTMKFDGLTICLSYDNGKLTSGSTRGTGLVGEEILPQIKTIENIPLELKDNSVQGSLFDMGNVPSLCEIRGEAIMTQEAFDRYNETAENPLKNLRNGAAGALRNLDLSETRRRHLSAWFYDINYLSGMKFDTYMEELEYLEKQGFSVHPYHVHCKNIMEVRKAIEDIEKLRDTLNFDIDGAVVAINDLSLRDTLGVTAKFPRYSIAFKFEALEATTTLLDVEWNVGRTGKVTPTAILEPCDIGGVTVSRATLNNIHDIRRKGLYYGARVFLRRSNDVIPEITGVTEEKPIDAREIEQPVYCPVCGAKLEEEGQLVFCPNSIGCKPQMVKALAHFGSREAMNIEGFSEKTAEQLFEDLDLRSVDELYTLTNEQLMTLDKFKDKKAGNLIEAIEKSKNCSLSSFVFGLGIPGIGKKTAIDLSEHFGTIEKVMAATKEELLLIEDIGEILADNIVGFFNDEKIKNEIERLLLHGVNPAPVSKVEIKDDEATEFYGKTIVVTGTLESFSRTEIKEKLHMLGAKPSESVSAKTDYLLVGTSPGSKYDKAKALNEKGQGPKIISEDEFIQMIGGK